MMKQCSRCRRAELIGEKVFPITPHASVGANLSIIELSQLPVPPVFSCKACLTDTEIVKLLAPAVLFVLENAMKAGVRDVADMRAGLIHVSNPDALRDRRKAALEALG